MSGTEVLLHRRRTQDAQPTLDGFLWATIRRFALVQKVVQRFELALRQTLVASSQAAPTIRWARRDQPRPSRPSCDPEWLANNWALVDISYPFFCRNISDVTLARPSRRSVPNPRTSSSGLGLIPIDVLQQRTPSFTMWSRRTTILLRMSRHATKMRNSPHCP
jgi:hypothetical protein